MCFRSTTDLVQHSLRVFGLALIFALLSISPSHAQKRIALSFDDIPRSPGVFFTPDERRAKLIAALKQAKVRQAVFFVNPGQLKGGDDQRILDYVDAGHVIANHSFSHPRLSTTKIKDYLSDIDLAETWLKGRKGYRPWFRFPFLDEGQADKEKRDILRAALKSRGLRNGYVTAESSDWHMEELTRAAKRDGKSMNMDALRDLYVTRHVEAADFYDNLARKTIGRSPVHVMLLHETDIAALFIGDLVTALRKGGWTIVSADKAYSDKLANAMPDVPSAQGTLTEALAWQKGLPAPRWYKYNDVQLITEQFNASVLKEAPAK
jgi:peptidoglycan-N-acetylglucosamine deacetylase